MSSCFPRMARRWQPMTMPRKNSEYLDARQLPAAARSGPRQASGGMSGFRIFSRTVARLPLATETGVQLIAVDGKSEPRVLKDVLAGYIRSLAFSRDGQTLLTAGSSKDQRQCLIHLWDLGAEPKSLADLCP